MRRVITPAWEGENESLENEMLLDGFGKSRATTVAPSRRRAEWWEVPRVEKRAAFKRFPDSWPQLKSLGSAAPAALAAMEEMRAARAGKGQAARPPAGGVTADPQSLAQDPDPFLAAPDPYTLTAQNDPLLLEMARRAGPGVVL